MGAKELIDGLFAKLLCGKAVRTLATDVCDAKEVDTPISECKAEGGPEHCRYHKQFVHKEGEGLHSHYNTKKVVEIGKNKVYIDTGKSENWKFIDFPKVAKTDKDGKKIKDKNGNVVMREMTAAEKRDSVRSNPNFGSKIYKDGKTHSEEVARKKHMKAVKIVMKVDKSGKGNGKETFLDHFTGVEPIEKLKMEQFNDEECYIRSADPIAGYTEKVNARNGKTIRSANKAKDGEAQYKWTKGGKELSNEEALNLEGAIRSLTFGACLSADSSDVKIRPDFATGYGQVMTYKNGDGQMQYPKTKAYQDALDRDKNKRIMSLYPHYDDIMKKIFDDAEKGKPEAILAYFMYRTKCRAGSEQNPTDAQGRGATTLRPKDFDIDGNTVHIEFPAKNGFWHISVEDEFLANFCRKRKEEIRSNPDGVRKDKFFGVSYDALRNYLKDISAEYVGGNRELAFRPHNFRHFAATRIVEEELKGANPNDKEKYETAVCKAVSKAASILNDEGSTVFAAYLIPQIAFKGNERFQKENYRFMNETREAVLGGNSENEDEEDD